MTNKTIQTMKFINDFMEHCLYEPMPSYGFVDWRALCELKEDLRKDELPWQYRINSEV